MKNKFRKDLVLSVKKDEKKGSQRYYGAELCFNVDGKLSGAIYHFWTEYDDPSENTGNTIYVNVITPVELLGKCDENNRKKLLRYAEEVGIVIEARDLNGKKVIARRLSVDATIGWQIYYSPWWMFGYSKKIERLTDAEFEAKYQLLPPDGDIWE
ncbi:MAG: hypothetical protein LBL47_03135 [Lactobacillus sp.]|jgi:hypothetical protein|nr:hypothetical protein [Lactobacillus sp.]